MFFETFVTADENWLPPDNFQEYPQPVVATRTSPTNIGLAMLSTLAAHDFGYVSLRGLMEKIGRSLATVEKTERYRGHFYNWYDTHTLKPMAPLYLSTVDNGNLAGLLLTLHSACLNSRIKIGTPPESSLGCATRLASGKTSRAIREPIPVLKRWKNCSRKIRRRRGNDSTARQGD